MEHIYMSGPQVTDADIQIVLDALQNGWYGTDAYKYVELFESEFAKFHNRKFALMTPNCTSAIHLYLTAIGINSDDEVIVPDVTWIASVAPVVYLNASAVFADVDRTNWCLTKESIAERITPKTKAVIVVDLYGNMPNFESIENFCKENGLFLIEDSAEALGSKFKSQRAGSFGDASVFSFHRTKTLTTGEGGILLLDNEKVYERAKFLRDHGRAPGTYFNTEVTYKYMPSNLAASLGYAQFLRLEELVNLKRMIWKKYSELFKPFEFVNLNPEPNDVINSVWSTVLVTNNNSKLTRDVMMREFDKRNIPTRPFFYPLSKLPAFRDKVKQEINNQPISLQLSEHGICLPSALNLTEENIERVVEVFDEFADKY
jgi:perosamine synthetase